LKQCFILFIAEEKIKKFLKKVLTSKKICDIMKSQNKTERSSIMKKHYENYDNVAYAANEWVDGDDFVCHNRIKSNQSIR